MTDTIETAITAEKESLESRVAALEGEAKTWFVKHVGLICAIGGALVGLVIGHFV
jgi:hypothetical protein